MSIKNKIKSGLAGIVLAASVLSSSCSKVNENSNYDSVMNYAKSVSSQTVQTTYANNQAHVQKGTDPVRPSVEFNATGIYVNNQPSRITDEKIRPVMRSLVDVVKNSTSESVDVFNKDKKPSEEYSFVSSYEGKKVIAGRKELRLYDGSNLLLLITTPNSPLISDTYNILWKQYTNASINKTRELIDSTFNGFNYSPPTKK